MQADLKEVGNFKTPTFKLVWRQTINLQVPRAATRWQTDIYHIN